MKWILILFFMQAYAHVVLCKENIKGKPCCPGQNVLIGRFCHDNTTEDHSMLLKCKKYEVNPSKYSYDKYEVDENGYLVFHSTRKPIAPHKFCEVQQMVVIDENTTNFVTTAFVCFPEDKSGSVISETVKIAMMSISIISLILTLIVYGLVPKLRDIQGKCIICLCISLTIAFIHLAVLQTSQMNNKTSCYINAFGMYFWFLAAFVWMNVVSINVLRSVVVKNPTVTERMLFCYYNMYGWGAPLILLMATAIANNVEGNHIKPQIGVKSCWFREQEGYWVYFYGPIGVVLCANVIMFAVTSKYLWYKSSYDNVTKLKSLKYKFCLYVKLLIVTGLSWIFELLSFGFDEQPVAFLITDIFNVLQGLVYFLMLVVFRKKALKGLAALGMKVPWVSGLNDDDVEENDEIIVSEEQKTEEVASYRSPGAE